MEHGGGRGNSETSGRPRQAVQVHRYGPTRIREDASADTGRRECGHGQTRVRTGADARADTARRECGQEQTQGRTRPDASVDRGRRKGGHGQRRVRARKDAPGLRRRLTGSGPVATRGATSRVYGAAQNDDDRTSYGTRILLGQRTRRQRAREVGEQTRVRYCERVRRLLVKEPNDER